MPRSYDHTLLCPGGGGLTYLISVDSSETKYLTTRFQVFFLPNKEEAYAFWNVLWMVLYFIFFLWMSFVLKSRCQCMILNLWWFVVPTSCSPAVLRFFTYIIPLNRANVDALVLWISLMPLAVLGVWGPLKALSISPSIRIRIRMKYVQSGWLHLSAFFFSPTHPRQPRSEAASFFF